MEKPNSLLAPRITASTNSLYGLIDKFGDQLAAEKLKHSGTDTKPSDMEDARNALKGGGRAIGYHIDHKTGKVTFVELEIRDSLFGVGGRPAPKRGDDNKAHWLAAIPFAQSFTGSSAQPVLLTHLHAPFQDWSALPQPVKEFSGVSNLHVHQQQQFLDELNRKWPQWEEDYKKVHAGDVTDDINVLAGKIIARENVKQAITEIVAAAAAVKEPPPPQPSPT
jgi:hypothetical protein